MASPIGKVILAGVLSGQNSLSTKGKCYKTDDPLGDMMKKNQINQLNKKVTHNLGGAAAK